MLVNLIYGNGLSTPQRGLHVFKDQEMWHQQLEQLSQRAHGGSGNEWKVRATVRHEVMLFRCSPEPGIWNRCYMNETNAVWKLLHSGCVLRSDDVFLHRVGWTLQLLIGTVHPKIKLYWHDLLTVKNTNYGKQDKILIFWWKIMCVISVFVFLLLEVL